MNFSSVSARESPISFSGGTDAIIAPAAPHQAESGISFVQQPNSSSQAVELLEQRGQRELENVAVHVSQAKEVLNSFQALGRNAAMSKHQFILNEDGSLALVAPTEIEKVDPKKLEAAANLFFQKCTEYYGGPLVAAFQSDRRQALCPYEVEKIITCFDQIVARVIPQIMQEASRMMEHESSPTTSAEAVPPSAAGTTSSAPSSLLPPEQYLFDAIAQSVRGLAAAALPVACTGIIATIPLGLPPFLAAVILNIPCAVGVFMGIREEIQGSATPREERRQIGTLALGGIGGGMGAFAGFATPLMRSLLAPHLHSAPLVSLGLAKGLGVLVGGLVLGAGAGALWMTIMGGSALYAATAPWEVRRSWVNYNRARDANTLASAPTLHAVRPLSHFGLPAPWRRGI